MAKKKKTSPKPKPPRPYHLLLPFLVSVAASLVYVAPQEVPKVSMAVVKCIPILYLMWVILKKENLGGEVTLVFLALSTSIIGDYYLIWPDESFLEGVLSFFVTQALYIASLGFELVNWQTGALAYSLNLFVLTYIYTVLPSPVLKIAVTFYSFCLTTTLWRALDRAIYHKDISWERRMASATGAVTLVVSDLSIGALQLGRLVPHFAAQLVILSTYYLGQLLLVLGACGRLWKA